MIEFRYGPIELYLVGFTHDQPCPTVLKALAAQLEGGFVRLVDFLVITKSTEGDVSLRDLSHVAQEHGLVCADLDGVWLAGDEDIADFAELVEPGTSAALVAIELLYAREIAERIDRSGASILSAERIPAPVVNAVFAASATAA